MKIIQTRRAYSVYEVNYNDPPPDRAEELIDAAEMNRGHVIYGAAMVEKELEIIIRDYFFSRHQRDLKETFEHHVLCTSFFTFDAKRAVAKEVAERKGYKDAKWRDRFFDTDVRSIMRYRNAFTHGSLATNGKEVKLSWFSAGPQTAVLTDDYLTKIEELIDRVHIECLRIQVPGLKIPGVDFEVPKSPTRPAGNGKDVDV